MDPKVGQAKFKFQGENVGKRRKKCIKNRPKQRHQSQENSFKIEGVTPLCKLLAFDENRGLSLSVKQTNILLYDEKLIKWLNLHISTINGGIVSPSL